MLPKSLFPLLISSSPSILPSTLALRWVSTKTLQTPHFIHRLLNSQQHRPKLYFYERALVSALKSISTHLAISQGRQIHCVVLKSGFDSNTFVHNSLISMYAKCGFVADATLLFHLSPGLDTVSYNIMISACVKAGKIDDARELYEIMPERDCVSFTTMIMGFSQNGYCDEAIDVFEEMRKVGLVPNEVTMASVISAFSHLRGISNCRMLHALVVKMMLDGLVLVSTNLLRMYCVCLSLGDARALFDGMVEKNIFSWNVMLNGYAKAGHIKLARDVFEKIPDKDVVSWCTLIDGYIQAERLSEAFMMFCSMLSTGLGPNEVVMVDLISACGRALAIDEGQQLHSIIVKRGFNCYDYVQATVIHLYAACGRIKEACLQFEVGIKGNIASWNALIAGFIRNRMVDRAAQLFNDMPERDVFSWSTMISGYQQSGQPSMAVKLFHAMLTTGIQPNEVTMVSVFSAIAALGTLKEGIRAHEFVRNNFTSLNDNLSASIIDMYAKCGSINTALEVFYRIRNKVSTVSPWNAIICGLATHGHANLSLEIYSDLQQCRIKLNAITFIGVLNACCHAGLVKLGETYFKDMQCVHNIYPDIRHYGCMVDLLGRAGRLEEAEEMVRRMPMKADVMIWGTLLAACKTHGNVDKGERAAKNLARLAPSHAPSRVLLSNLYADAGRWEDAFLVRRAMQGHQMQRMPGYSGVR